MNFNTSGLLEPQKEHAKFLAKSLIDNGIAWDGSATGTGKTYSASAVIRHLNTDFCVICPKLVIPVWEKVLASFGLTAKFLINYEKLCRGNTKWLKYRKQKKTKIEVKSTGKTKVILEPEMECINLRIPAHYVVILDESHKCKATNSLQAGLMMALKRQNYKTLMLSATQATSPLDMRAFGLSTNLHDGTMKKYKEFCIEAGAEWVGKWGALTFDSDEQKSKEKMLMIHNNLFNIQKIGSRLTRKDFGDIFPKSQVVAEAYDMGVNSDKIQQAYDDMEYELDLLEEKTANYKDHILAVITRMRRKVEMLKVPTIVDMANELYDEGKSVLMFVNYTDTIEAIHGRLVHIHGEDLVGRIYGEQTNKQKLADIAGFQADRKRFSVMNLAAGGQSISMHDLNGNFPRASLINPSFSAINVLQSMGRHDRAYALTDCYTRFIYSAKCSVEENVCRRFQFKKDNIELLNDGDLTPERLFHFVGGMNL